MASAIGTIHDASDPPKTTRAVSTNPVAPSAAWSSDSAHGAICPRSTRIAMTSPPIAPIAKTSTAILSIDSLLFVARFSARRITLSTFAITKLPNGWLMLDSKRMTAIEPIETARSRDRILELLLKAGEPLSVPALARALGISRNASHQLVVALEREGLVERASPIRTKGRPSRSFRLSPAGRATFPRQYALLARQLLGELAHHLGPDELRQALQR